ncbi:MAG: hypothetical protein SCALA701_03780 [Candidatus Scalindua sp.]|nr:MAG: hypothetical protein DWQ00_17505 [Candidatus Scalindua sp.]GJQ57577.1 MAG: hypothetical protein SCALA701_03780 [Candidatus Scalindua sp.]
MIVNPNWRKPTSKPCFHQLSLNFIDKLGNYQEQLSKYKFDEKTYLNELKQMLSIEMKRPDFIAFVLENYTELHSYIDSGRIYIRIHIDETGKIWFGVG